jgi:hypothetical protein
MLYTTTKVCIQQYMNIISPARSVYYFTHTLLRRGTEDIYQTVQIDTKAPQSAHSNPLSAISGRPLGPPNLEISPYHYRFMSSISPSRTPLLPTRDHLQSEESDGRKMKFLYLDTEGWTRDDVRRTITFVSAVLVGLGR